LNEKNQEKNFNTQENNTDVEIINKIEDEGE
jgi:hypothetical protein